jgi:hypothetical protein
VHIGCSQLPAMLGIKVSTWHNCFGYRGKGLLMTCFLSFLFKVHLIDSVVYVYTGEGVWKISVFFHGSFDWKTVCKLLKKGEGTLCPVGSLSVIKPSTCFVLVHPRPSFYCYNCSASFCQKLVMSKMLKQQIPENGPILWKLFFNALSQEPEEHNKPSQ